MAASELLSPKEARIALLLRMQELYPNWCRVDLQSCQDEDGLIWDISDALSPNLKPLLPNRASLVLSLRFGLMDGKLRTLEKVGEIIDLSIERVREIEADALYKMAFRPRRDCLSSYIHIRRSPPPTLLFDQ